MIEGITKSLVGDESLKVYFNYSEEIENFLSRKKMISILKSIPNNPIITLGVVYNAEHSFALTSVVKCSPDCFCVHLSCGYEKDSILRN